MNSTDQGCEVHARLERRVPHCPGRRHYPNVGRGDRAEGGKKENNCYKENNKERTSECALHDVAACATRPVVFAKNFRRLGGGWGRKDAGCR
eukprot:315964-Rhodomonas_salina.1